MLLIHYVFQEEQTGMKPFSSKLYAFSIHFIQLLGLVLTFCLFLGGFLFTCYAANMETQQVLTAWDNPFFGLLGIFLFLAAGPGLCLLSMKLLPKASQTKFLLFAVLVWQLILGALLILSGKTVPAADSMSVYAAAEALASGDTSVIHPTDSYLSYYPQQIGLTAFYELLIRIWKLFPFSLPAYHFIKCINVILACVIVVFQYKTAQLLWKSVLTHRLYLLLAAANAPFIMYTSFVYGEIPSFAAVSIGFYCLLKLLQSPSRHLLYGSCSVVFMALSVMLRKNSLILVIAALIVLVFQALVQSGRRFLLLLALLCAVSGFGILPLVQNAYELRSGNSLKSGVPAISYLAMGMQEASRGNGWYNGFNFNTYRETGMDTSATAAISKEAISKRLQYFCEHPGYGADFYLKKHLSQWADGTYAARQATLATFGGRTEFFNKLYAGEYSSRFIAYCNIYQNVLYLGAFLFCLTSVYLRPGTAQRRRQKPDGSGLRLPMWLGMIGVVGGFLFHIFWEANSRYIFPYSLLLMPYAAEGLGCLFSRITCSSKIQHKKSGHNNVKTISDEQETHHENV